MGSIVRSTGYMVLHRPVELARFLGSWRLAARLGRPSRIIGSASVKGRATLLGFFELDVHNLMEGDQRGGLRTGTLDRRGAIQTVARSPSE
jgi:hypothetical protein